MDRTSPASLSCPFCGRVHRAVPIRFRERALCVDCGATLTRRPITQDASLAFTVTAIVFAVPAVQLPIVVVRKFGVEHASYLWTGVSALWRESMPLLSVWVALCGLVVPLGLLATLGMVLAPRFEPSVASRRFWSRASHALQHWSMPEVQVLAVLVAFIKIGALVDVEPGLGLWFYAAMTVAMLFAWRSAALHES